MIHGYRVRIARLEHGVNGVLGPLANAGKEGLVHTGHASRGILQSLAIGVFAEGLKDAGYGLPYLALLDRDSS